MADKQKALDAALAQIEKQFGKGSVMKLGDAATTQVSVIPTGCVQLDAALGVGDRSGRIIEVYGPELPVKQRLHCRLWRRFRRTGELLLL